ncbi:MAG: hypothetical protein JNL22_12305 [Bacteroidales bacterium]|nr:hypothetical protein [Bacteroidales bacterium]
MKKKLFAAALVLCSMVVLAQKSAMKFGKIDPEYFSMKSYPADSSAGALILGDIGDISITWNDARGWCMEFHRHFRVKVFNSHGFDLANFKITTMDLGPTYKEQITKLKASSYMMEGSKMVETSLTKDNVFIDEISSKEKSNNFSVPNLKEGCVFEVEYHIISDFYWILPDWEFQYTEPALFSELTVTTPEYFFFKTLMKGYISPTSTESKTYNRSIIFRYNDGTSNSVVYADNSKKFRFNDVPAFREEPFMTSVNNYLAAIEFELGSENFPLKKRDYTMSWEKISKELLEDTDFGVQLKRSCPLKDEAAALKISKPDPKERMIAAFELIRNSMSYNDKYGKYVTKNLRSAWDEKKGKSSDINLLLVSLLNEAGIEADPVILSTRENGALHPGQIILGKFNYVIAEARIGEERFLLDATDKKLPYTMLPERCLNGKGRRISQTPSLNDWVNLMGGVSNERQLYAVTSLHANGNVSGEFSLMETAYYAHKRAEQIRAENTTDDYITKYESDYSGLYIDEMTIENTDDRLQPLYLKYKGTYNLSDESIKDIIYMNPTLGAGLSSNPFTAESREYPVDFKNPFSQKIINTITLPEGYDIAELPKSAMISLPDQLGNFRYSIAVNGSMIQFMSVLALRTAVITSENYPYLKELYSHIVAKNSELIVLKKR